MSKQLAIIIPAYKDTFLRQALDSITAQTCQDFTLYVGDDCSPYDIGAIVNEYKDKIDLVYKRFDTNLGGKDLVAQWERCIDMSHDEPYIWLFSDDDVMEPRCVESFINQSDEIKASHVIHFNISVIDEFDSGVLKSEPKYPQFLNSKDYLDEKLHLNGRKGLNSYVVEFIFSREIYSSTGKFQNYDLAWGADFLTWLKFSAACKGIYTIDSTDAKVRWRRSNQNISPDSSRPVMIRKVNSLIDNAAYIQQYLKEHKYRQEFKYAKFVWGVVRRKNEALTTADVKNIYRNFVDRVGFRYTATLFYVIIMALRILKR